MPSCGCEGSGHGAIAPLSPQPATQGSPRGDRHAERATEGSARGACHRGIGTRSVPQRDRHAERATEGSARGACHRGIGTRSVPQRDRHAERATEGSARGACHRGDRHAERATEGSARGACHRGIGTRSVPLTDPQGGTRFGVRGQQILPRDRTAQSLPCGSKVPPPGPCRRARLNSLLGSAIGVEHSLGESTTV